MLAGTGVGERSSVDRRRELNRVAAQKLRNRQKEKAVIVKQVLTNNCYTSLKCLASLIPKI